MTQIEISEKWEEALNLMEHSYQNLFITGEAGTGKSTLLEYFRKTSRKKLVVLAPTGVAALNVHGQTIHSFFGFKPNVTAKDIKQSSKKIYKNLETIVIDEVSMVRADLLDYIDRFMRLNGPDGNSPFGGVQMIFIGDLYQLPPIVSRDESSFFQNHYASPYFFDAKVFEKKIFEGFEMDLIRLSKVYRQKDQEFIHLLNQIRNNTINYEGLDYLNRNHQPDFNHRPDKFYICLTTTNALADTINSEQLAKLPQAPYEFAADISGNFDRKSIPNSNELRLKIGAQIMMLNNDKENRWVNGSLGKILAIRQDYTGDRIIEVELSDGSIVEVERYKWEIFNYSFDPEAQSLKSEIVGSFTQYPMRLAWAVTIHKSQGKTFDRVIIDIGNGAFAHGQIYVALSRCTNLEGIVLKKPIRKRDIIMDERVAKWLA